MRRRAALASISALLVVPGFAPLQYARAQAIEVIALRHRSADSLLPLLLALVEPGGGLTGQGFELFLRTSPANSRQLRELIARLDTPPRQLLITVRQERAQASVEQGTGADGSVTVTSRGASGSVTVEARNSRTVGASSGEQQIRVLEGGRATITMSSAVPFTFRQWIPAAGGGWTVTRNTTFYEALRGFHVQPRLNGTLVALDITPVESSFAGAAIESLRLATQVQVRLGDWVALGGADQRADGVQTGLLASGQEAITSQRGVWMKVDLAD